MDNYNIIRYNKLEFKNITFGRNDVYDVNYVGIGTPCVAKNCTAVFCTEKAAVSASTKIIDNVGHNDCMAPDKIYVHPDCSTRRDLFRNSGYEIKLKPETANYYVIPSPVPMACFENIEMAVYNSSSGVLKLFTIDHRKEDRSYRDNIIEFDHNILKRDYEIPAQTTVYFTENGNNNLTFYVEILKDNEYWWDILRHDRWDSDISKYALETEVEIMSSVKVSPETFALWRSMDDDNAAISICNSDWKDYPFTVWTFIKLYLSDIYISNSMFRYIERMLDKDGEFRQKIVSAKDWNMLQDCICYLANGTTEKGFVTGNLGKLINLIPNRILVKPMKIDKDASVSELINKVKRS